MRLDQSTWREVEAYLERSPGIILPTGSTEQHGPIGLIGTDALCAETIATGAAERSEILIAPTICYAPAPFNMAFPGTVSISEPLFEAMVAEIIAGLSAQGFRLIYVLNGHGANIAPMRRAAASANASTGASTGAESVIVRSWWDFPAVNAMRKALYGDWEGMHATPSEVAITQASHRIVRNAEANKPPEKLSADYIRDHAGDRHGPPNEHRRRFPDGRVGSHSALATREDGEKLLAAAIEAVSEDYAECLTALTE